MAILYHLRVSRAGTEIRHEAVTAVICLIGRGEDCDLSLADPMRVISRHHARVTFTEDVGYVEDLDSQAGTLLNGERIPKHKSVVLPPGSVLTVGPYEMTYEPTAVPDTSTQPKTPESPTGAQPTSSGDEGGAEDSGHGVVGDENGGYEGNGRYQPLPGLHKDYSRYLQYLPGIYHTHYMTRFLALLESLLAPVEWNVENFDLYLDPQTSPEFFLPWLAQWFGLTFHEGWCVERQREVLLEAHQIYKRRGTAWALHRLLKIYTKVEPEIVDDDPQLEAHTFWVKLPLAETREQRIHIEQLINAHKPAHTKYRLIFTQS